MTFQNINSTLAGSDLTYFIVYCNQVTNNLFSPLMLLAFFIVITITSMVMQLKFSGRIKPEVSLLAGSFSTLLFATILLQRTGLIDPITFVICLVVFILSLVWVALSGE